MTQRQELSICQDARSSAIPDSLRRLDLTRPGGCMKIPGHFLKGDRHNPAIRREFLRSKG